MVQELNSQEGSCRRTTSVARAKVDGFILSSGRVLTKLLGEDEDPKLSLSTQGHGSSVLEEHQM